MPNGASGVNSLNRPAVPSPNSFRITLKVSREFAESSLGFEPFWKFLQEPVKRSKDLGSTVFLDQFLKNDGCANVLVETKTSHVFEAIVYFRHYVIGIHKFVLKCCISSNVTTLYPSVSDLHVDLVTRVELHFALPDGLVQIHFAGSTIYAQNPGYSAGWIVEISSFLISLQMKSSISGSER